MKYRELIMLLATLLSVAIVSSMATVNFLRIYSACQISYISIYDQSLADNVKSKVVDKVLESKGQLTVSKDFVLVLMSSLFLLFLFLALFPVSTNELKRNTVVLVLTGGLIIIFNLAHF